MEQARLLEQQGRYKEAEKYFSFFFLKLTCKSSYHRLYVTINDPDQAIQMYKRLKNYDNMLKLIKQYHPDLLADTYSHLAKVYGVLF